ncbi:MAG: hypothetical protein DCF21_11125 [Leptolyngbya sp.]|uniref:Transposase zinc-ribbon domain-containing protein n=1 Tax=Shackletoniella antarctica TaxID=268115 RepID=A0A2W4Y7S6_9CYAN|nr:MAG: hypothetical protein DCF17_13400 [Shackletoniella antarctica]PZV15897.1 MAG: hypothetical protein DCF21_11125 [Leptolyngbya sp.]
MECSEPPIKLRKQVIFMTTKRSVSAPAQKHWEPSLIDHNQSTNTQRCPCCSHTLLRHIRLNQLYWRCGHCHQAMPTIDAHAVFID